MSKSSISDNPALSLCRDTLTIKKIICFASGNPGWPPTDEFWDGIQADLKDACERSELPHSRNPGDPRRRFYHIRLLDLLSFLANQDRRWQPLRDFCQRWEQARGVTLSNAVTTKLAVGAPQLDVEIQETRREKRAREKQEMYKGWYSLAQDIKAEGKWTSPTDIARAIAKRVGGSDVNWASTKRRLDEHYPGWATKTDMAQKTGRK